MQIAFVGDLCLDVNVVRGKASTASGGGVLHAGVTARLLGAEVTVYAKCAQADLAGFKSFTDAAVKVVLLPTRTTTSIRNEYPTDNPDDRVSRTLARAEPVREEEVLAIKGEVLHINPLWYGAFPDSLIPVVRRKVAFLGADAQGFLRQVLEDGSMVHRDWAAKERYLPLLDLFKVDIKEAEILTGTSDLRLAARRLHELGVKTVLLTHQAGVCVFDGDAFHESAFSPYTIDGRTGRGDTYTAAFLVGRERGIAEATRFAAKITSEKMQYPGPYRAKLAG
ncbi:MAG: PfkB family carbohydrate kinase [Myxococcaceae bacterium]